MGWNVTGPVILLAGPTASGKSTLAMALARRVGGVVINADSMQVYRELRVVTARPTVADEAAVPHHLYGVISASQACSAARWRGLAMAEIEAAGGRGEVPIVVGGGGLYLRALVRGLAPVPDVPVAARDDARARHAKLGGDAFHAALAARDPAMAARLHAGDTQRLIRAWEVIAATGRSLADWQAMAPEAPLDAPVYTALVAPDRVALYAACDARFERMLADGALEEVAALDALGLDGRLPAMKALGVPALRCHLRGEIPLAEARAAAQQATRNYAKRQLTWFRHQITAELTLSGDSGDAPSLLEGVERFLLTAQGRATSVRRL